MVYLHQVIRLSQFLGIVLES